MSREIKIGIFAAIAIAIAIIGYNYLKGKNLLGQNNTFFIEYGNVDQLQNSAPVLVNGLGVGMVKNIYLKPDDYTRIVVEIEVTKDVRIPKNTVAEIIATSIMGGKSINLKFEGVCSGEDCAKSGDYLAGVTKGLLDSMVGLDKLEDYTDVLRVGVTKMLDTISSQLKDKDNEVGKSLKDLQLTLQNLRSTTGQLDQMIAASKGDIIKILDNFEVISTSIKDQSDQIKNIISNADTFTGQLKDMDLKTTSNEANLAIANLKNTLATADKALADIAAITTKIKKGEGSLGLLINDKAFHENLNSALNNLELLLQDVRLNPKRYTRILSRKQIPYEKPQQDPGLEGE